MATTDETLHNESCEALDEELRLLKQSIPNPDSYLPVMVAEYVESKGITLAAVGHYTEEYIDEGGVSKRLAVGYDLNGDRQSGQRWDLDREATLMNRSEPIPKNETRRNMMGQPQPAVMMRSIQEALAADTGAVVLVEGITDGLIAMTHWPDATAASCLGQVKKIIEWWPPDWPEALIVVADRARNKDTGQLQTNPKLDAWVAAAAGRVTAIYPPPEHKDVSDWVADGVGFDGVQKIRKLIDKAHHELAEPALAVLPEGMHWQNGEAVIEALRMIGWAVRLNTDTVHIEYAELSNGLPPAVLSPEWRTLNEEDELPLRAEIQTTVGWWYQYTTKDGDTKRQRKPIRYKQGTGPEGWGMWRAHAAKMRSVSPRKGWLNSLHRWDGVPRLAFVLHDTLGVDDTRTACSDKALYWMMCCAVKRIRQPGTKHDLSLLLNGPVGIGKSTLPKLLLPPETRDEWYRELQSINRRELELREELAGALIVELPELVGIDQVNMGMLLSFMTRTSFDNARKFEKSATKMKVGHVMFGTTNPDRMMPYHRGLQRRWHPVVATGRDDMNGPDDLAAYLDEKVTNTATRREMLWAETVARIDAGDAAYPTKAEEAQIMASVEKTCMLHGWLDEWAETTVTEMARTGESRSHRTLRLSVAEEAKQFGERAVHVNTVWTALDRAAAAAGLRVEAHRRKDGRYRRIVSG